MSRTAKLERVTGETAVAVSLSLDGDGVATIDTGLGFLNHMLGALARHSGIDLEVAAEGDTDVDDHHTVEDCAIVIGRVLSEALGDGAGIRRFASAHAPLDESLARAVVDLSGRSWPEIDISFARDRIGDVAAENITHFLRTLAVEGRMTLHVDVLRGDNDHHKAEAAFKAVALALREATAVVGGGAPSTKGALG